MSERLLLGHRGALEERTENTIDAFERAVELGAHGVELDVRVAGDGTVVVFHDETLHRLAGRLEPVAALSWEQLSKVELVGNARIPRLRDVLDALGEEVWLDVEIKPAADAPVEATVDMLGARPNTFLSSFDPRLLRRARDHGFAGDMGLLLERISPAFLHAEGGREFGAESVILDAEITSQAVVDRYHAMGYTLGVYGARDFAHEDRLWAMGIRWLITDWPRTR